jgi:hypothetical protein
VYHEGQILNTSTGVVYNIRATCIFSADETISIHYLKRQIHVDLKLLPSHFNITISARINTNVGNSLFEEFGVVSEEIWGIVKTTAPY